MMGSVKAGYECIKAFSETDFTEDLKAIEVPVLVIHSEDDQIVPYADSAPLTVNLLKDGTLVTYKDLPHGLCQTHPEIVNADLLAFIAGDGVPCGGRDDRRRRVRLSWPGRRMPAPSPLMGGSEADRRSNDSVACSRSELAELGWG
jgi:hypothetical protein